MHARKHTHDFLTRILTASRKEHELVILNNWG